MGLKSQQPEAEKPLDDTDVLEAIRASGYPFEVKLLQQFKAADIHAAISVPRPKGSNGETKEIDIAAQISRLSNIDDSMIQVELFAFIEAKKFNPPKCFIGIATEPLGTAELIARGAGIGGVPSCGYIQGMPCGSLPAMGFLDAFRVISGRPYCAHWAIGRRKDKEPNKNRPWAAGDPKLWNNLVDLQRVARYEGKLFARGPLESVRGQAMPVHLRFYTAALAIDTDCLHFYDPVADLLRKTEWLTYRPNWGTMIDIVSRNGVAELITTYKLLADSLIALVAQRAPELQAIAAVQKEWWDNLDVAAKARIDAD